jgi:hypothetical protein
VFLSGGIYHHVQAFSTSKVYFTSMTTTLDNKIDLAALRESIGLTAREHRCPENSSLII